MIRTRGRLKRTWTEAVEKDMVVVTLTKEMTLKRAQWSKRIRVDNHKDWHKGSVVTAAALPCSAITISTW